MGKVIKLSDHRDSPMDGIDGGIWQDSVDDVCLILFQAAQGAEGGNEVDQGFIYAITKVVTAYLETK